MADWPKKDGALIERVDGLLSIAPVRRKNMFGTAAWFLESNDMMFVGAWGEGIMVRVGEGRTKGLIESGDAEPFDPMGGRPMREYVFIGGHRIAEDDELLSWLDEASDFAGTLPPKKKKKSKKPRYKPNRTTQI
ncbi:MAG: TfoX/Sxy family protein [Chloroflexi bacterium]|nr:TfoX/Sxy family protein [Chloroflexota bacterium]